MYTGLYYPEPEGAIDDENQNGLVICDMSPLARNESHTARISGALRVR